MSNDSDFFKNMTYAFNQLALSARESGALMMIRKLRLAHIRENHWHWWDIKHKIEYKKLLKECVEDEK